MRKRGRFSTATETATAVESKPDTLLIPHDPINEAVVIAAVVVSEEARARYLTLPPTMFLAPGHPEIWGTLQDIFKRGLTYDPATVRQLSGGRVDPAVIDTYIAARPELPPNLGHHVEVMAWDAARIAAAKGPVGDFLTALRDPTCDPDRLRALHRAIGGSLDGHGANRYLKSSATIVAEHSAELAKRRTGHASYPYGIAGLDYYGPEDFDERHLVNGKPRPLDGNPRMVPGAGPGQMTVVFGESGNGKTTLTARWVLHWARQKQRTVWGAWEQMNGPSLELLAAMSLGWSIADVKIGDYTEAEQAELEAEMRTLGEYVQFLDLPFDRKLGERGRRNEANFDLIQRSISDADAVHFIGDLFHLALSEKKPEDELAGLYRFKAIGLEERCHMVACAQANIKTKEGDDGGDKRPRRDRVKGSTGYIEASDTCVAPYRPYLYRSVPDDKIELHILKQRHGKWPQVVECDWDPEYGLIEGGRTIAVERPGEKGEVDNYLDDVGATGRPRKQPRGGRKRFT